MTMVTSDGGGAGLEAIDYNDETIRSLISDQITKGASPMEFKLFIEQCRYTGLNPLMGQIHCVPRYDKKLKRDVFKAQTGIDGFRLIAKRSHEYAGQDEPEWCGPDGQWTDVWPDKTVYPTAARIRVYHHDYPRPIVGIVMWDEFVPMVTVYGDDNKPLRKNGELVRQVTPMWREKPAHMLAKCAEAQALRKAFPNELSGLYTDDEMARSDVNARREQRRTRTTTSTAAPTPHEDGEVRHPPATRDTTGEDMANADDLATFRNLLKGLNAESPTTAARLIEAWRESEVPPIGAITTAQDLIDAKLFVATFVSTYSDGEDTEVHDGDIVDRETGEIREDEDGAPLPDEPVTQDAEVIETPEPERPPTGDEMATRGLDKPPVVQPHYDDEGDGHPISDRQLRKIRGMYAKAALRGDVSGDVHDYAAALVGFKALESLKNLTSTDASTVIRALEALEEPKE